ncbi:MAG TPA: hypothetical protein VM144_18055 [Aestuariivirga sp.]|nr:hypothetical protein [Aestuariivirga sp.]
MIKVLLAAFAVVWITIGQAAAAASETTAQFDEETGLFVIRHHTVDVVKANFVFWTGKWVWSGLNLETMVNGPFDYSFSGVNKDNGLAVEGTAMRASTTRMEYRMHVGPGADVYGGLSFKFRRPPLSPEALAPQIDVLPGQDGWSFKLAANEAPVKIVISPAPSAVFFEPGQEEVRVYFAKPGENLLAGDYSLSVELPKGSAIVPTARERLSQPDLSWYKNLLDTSISPVDLSFLNAKEKPAGKHGTLGTQSDQLVFADGTPVRFWGTNLAAYALFQTGLSDTVKQAKRLSRLGFNLVRIHHIDSDWVTPNILGRETTTSFELNNETLRRLDWWIKALGDEGIYVWIDLNVGRVFSTDGLDDAGEMTRNGKGPTAQGYAYFSNGIEAKMKMFNTLLLNHLNPYTNLAYRDDPRIAFLLLTNENDLTHHFGNMFLPDKNRPQLNKVYMAEAARFAAEKGLNPEQTWRSWQFGPSKLFLNEFEHRFNERMIADIRSTGSKAVLSTTNSFDNITAAGLPSLADGGVVSINSYANSGVLETDPRYTPNLVSWIAAAGMAGKPLAITEWNMARHLSHERAALPAYLAAVASFQDWNAPIEYNYSQSPLDGPGRLRQWEMASDPALLAMAAVGALIFRQKHVKLGPTINYLYPTSAEFIDTALSAETSRAIRTLTETVRWRLGLPEIKELEWFKPASIVRDEKTITDMTADFSKPGEQVCAETGDFCRDWRRGVFTVDTPMTQVASGWIGGETITLKSATISLTTAHGALAIQSLDSMPITESRSILISMAAQTLLAKGDNESIQSEPIIGQIRFKAPPGLAAYAQLGDGRQKRIHAPYENGAYNLVLDAELGTYWIAFRNSP